MEDILTTHATNQGDRVAVIDDRPDGTLTQWTFAELEEKANRLGNALYALGVRPKEKVLWCGQNSAHAVVVINACRKIGVVAVPLNYRLTAEESAYVVDNSDAQLVIADAAYVELFSEIRNDIPQVKNILIFDGEPGENMLNMHDLMLASSTEHPPTAPEGEVAGTMIYTSGTTGKPKGAVRQSIGDPEQVAQMLTHIGYQTDDVYLTTGPLYHSGPGGFMGISQTLGNTVVVQHKFNPEDWLRLVDKYKVTSTFAAPTPIRMVCNLEQSVLDKYDCSSLRIMIANAAPWSFALKKSYLQHFPENSLFEVYGSTELGVNAILRPEDQLRKPGSCGKPSPGVEIKLFDEEGNEVTEPRKEGELFVRSKSVFSTYHKAHEKYEEERRGEWHTVGDIAYFDDEGYFFICDRKKDMIISGGVNIYPAEIEGALEHHNNIIDAAVFGIPSEEWGESVHAVVVVRPGEMLSEDEIITYARDHLAGYKVPRSISFLDEIPRNGSGKILKRTLREPFWKEHNSQVL